MRRLWLNEGRGGSQTRPYIKLKNKEGLMPFAKINGVDLYYETHGNGPALVLAHGGGGSHLSWWQQVPELSKMYNVITFDHRSFGQSLDCLTVPAHVPSCKT